jgi:hypothetical protein
LLNFPGIKKVYGVIRKAKLINLGRGSKDHYQGPTAGTGSKEAASPVLIKGKMPLW